jgi:excisionase family DNA binding protein
MRRVPTSGEWLTMRATADLLGVGWTTVEKVATQNGIRILKLNGLPPRFHRGDVERALELAVKTPEPISA